ncbi:protein-L-isoaspartate O-methyltransferase family protein [Paracoccaceae bacterium GXU_MW_L88]
MTDFAAARHAMVDCQIRPSDVTRYPIIDAMLNVPREEFVPVSQRPVAYAGQELPLGNGRVMLSPREFGKMLDAMEITPEELVLHIGTGLGYGAAVLGRLAEAVISVEENEDLAGNAAETLAAQQVDNVAITNGPLTAGDPDHAPYDVILIEGGVEEVPVALTDQLKDGGRIGAFVMEGAVGQFRVGYKSDSSISWRAVFDATSPVLPGFIAEDAFSL